MCSSNELFLERYQGERSRPEDEPRRAAWEAVDTLAPPEAEIPEALEAAAALASAETEAPPEATKPVETATEDAFAHNVESIYDEIDQLIEEKQTPKQGTAETHEEDRPIAPVAEQQQADQHDLEDVMGEEQEALEALEAMGEKTADEEAMGLARVMTYVVFSRSGSGKRISARRLFHRTSIGPSMAGEIDNACVNEPSFTYSENVSRTDASVTLTAPASGVVDSSAGGVSSGGPPVGICGTAHDTKINARKREREMANG